MEGFRNHEQLVCTIQKSILLPEKILKISRDLGYMVHYKERDTSGLRYCNIIPFPYNDRWYFKLALRVRRLFLGKHSSATG